MRSDHEEVLLRCEGELLLPRSLSLTCVVVEYMAPVRMRELARMMDEVAGYQRFLAARFDKDADMACRVSQRGHQAYLIADAMVGFHQIDQTRSRTGLTESRNTCW